MEIAERKIGSKHPPYVIAELSCNHCGQLDNAIKLIRAAKRAGADAVKTQIYTADTLTIDITKPDFILQGGPWQGRTLYDLYSEAQTPLKWHKELYSVARAEGIPMFSSVFDKRTADLAYELGAPAFKIASFEIVDIPLIEHLAGGDKPMIISTGLASDQEIKDADEASHHRAAFLHCVSEYPTLPENARLSRIIHLKQMFEHRREIGLSDHSLGQDVAVASIALGATIIEKHFRLEDSKTLEEALSLTPSQFSAMTKAVKTIYAGLKEQPTEGSPMRQFRRSLYVVKDIKKGDIYTTDNIRSIRPGYGLPPKMLPKILGKKAKRNWRKGDALS